MARPRTLTCPSCHADTTTRANPNVRVRCSGCGHMMRAPAIDDPWSGPAKTAPAASSGDTTPAEAKPAAAVSGPRVNRATAVKVRPPATKTPAPAGAPPRTRAQTKGAIGGRGATGFVGSRFGR